MLEKSLAYLIIITYVLLWFVGVAALTIDIGVLPSLVFGLAGALFGFWLLSWAPWSLVASIVSGIVGAAIGVWLMK